VCGIPDVLYVDHGSDFTSNHLDQVAASLRFRLVYSAVARPQGRGKIERLFGTLNSEVLPELPGHLVHGKPTTAPTLTLTELDRTMTGYITNTYHVRVHSETHQTPLDAWRGTGFLPRLPDNLEELDLLLVMHAKPRTVRRDGIHFQGLRYSHTTLAAYVGEAVTIRYDPRDLSEIRVFYHNTFLCRAVSEAHAGEAVTLKDIQAARRAHRRSLRTTINERVARVVDFLPVPSPKPHTEAQQLSRGQRHTKLRIYQEAIDERRAGRNIHRHQGASPVHGVRRGRAEAPLRRPLLWGCRCRQNALRTALRALGCGKPSYRDLERPP
jgi:putative transposase